MKSQKNTQLPTEMFSVKKLKDQSESRMKNVEGRIPSLVTAPGHWDGSNVKYCFYFPLDLQNWQSIPRCISWVRHTPSGFVYGSLLIIQEVHLWSCPFITTYGRGVGGANLSLKQGTAWGMSPKLHSYVKQDILLQASIIFDGNNKCNFHI